MAVCGQCRRRGPAGRRVGDRLERPERPVRGGDRPGRPGVGPAAVAAVRPRGARLAPTRSRSAISAAASFPFGGIRSVVGVATAFDQQALVRLAGDDGRAGVAAGQQAGPGVEPQPALLLVRAVAALALLDQDRADVRLEEPDRLRGGLVGRGDGRRPNDPAARSRPTDIDRRVIERATGEASCVANIASLATQ